MSKVGSPRTKILTQLYGERERRGERNFDGNVPSIETFNGPETHHDGWTCRQDFITIFAAYFRSPVLSIFEREQRLKGQGERQQVPIRDPNS